MVDILESDQEFLWLREQRDLLELASLNTGGVNPASCPKYELNAFHLDHDNVSRHEWEQEKSPFS